MTELKDVIGFYLGCEVRVFPLEGEEYTDVIEAIVIGESINLKETGDYYFDDDNEFLIAPILRKLSDMTEDEGREYAQHYGIKGHHPCTITEENGFVKISIGYKDHGASLFPMGQYGQKPESMVYLLSKHFDLFQLIDSGQAIDKATLIGGKQEEVKI